MSSVMKYKDYIGSVEFSEEDQADVIWVRYGYE